MSEFSGRVAHRDAATVVELSGDVDYGTSREVAELIQQVLADPMSELVIDLRDVGFIESVGVDTAIAADQASPRPPPSCSAAGRSCCAEAVLLRDCRRERRRGQSVSS